MASTPPATSCFMYVIWLLGMRFYKLWMIALRCWLSRLWRSALNFWCISIISWSSYLRSSSESASRRLLWAASSATSCSCFWGGSLSSICLRPIFYYSGIFSVISSSCFCRRSRLFSAYLFCFRSAFFSYFFSCSSLSEPTIALTLVVIS